MSELTWRCNYCHMEGTTTANRMHLLGVLSAVRAIHHAHAPDCLNPRHDFTFRFKDAGPAPAPRGRARSTAPPSVAR